MRESICANLTARHAPPSETTSSDEPSFYMQSSSRRAWPVYANAWPSFSDKSVVAGRDQRRPLAVHLPSPLSMIALAVYPVAPSQQCCARLRASFSSHRLGWVRTIGCPEMCMYERRKRSCRRNNLVCSDGLRKPARWLGRGGGRARPSEAPNVPTNLSQTLKTCTCRRGGLLYGRNSKREKSKTKRTTQHSKRTRMARQRAPFTTQQNQTK